MPEMVPIEPDSPCLVARTFWRGSGAARAGAGRAGAGVGARWVWGGAGRDGGGAGRGGRRPEGEAGGEAGGPGRIPKAGALPKTWAQALALECKVHLYNQI